VILPGFPTSAIFTFHEFVAPVIRTFAGRPADHAERKSGLPISIPRDALASARNGALADVVRAALVS
jgi:molybdopterin biosynthesis enzyme